MIKVRLTNFAILSNTPACRGTLCAGAFRETGRVRDNPVGSGLYTATSGRACFREREITAMAEADLTRYRRETVGFVFQFYNLMPSLTARENVDLVTEVASRPRANDAAQRGRGRAGRA
jgi:predicted ABC-type transport system involved in lysophospholipase L1 biosynthesis ATPase subunit